MKKLLAALLTLLPLLAFTQSEPSPSPDLKKHKIVIQLTSGDTLLHKSVVKQIHNILEAAPNSRIEVVCHNNGLSFLVSAQTSQAAKIRELKARGVEFYACENTMRDRKITRAELMPECGTVPSGVMEVIRKQEKRWSYLRAGN